jgi:prepilin-type N-terminal cleavage/methylation domain-containing protein
MRIATMRKGMGGHDPTRDPGRRPRRAGFSLAEMIVALVLAALVLTAVLGVYGQANRAVSATLQKVEGPALAAEVLQLIAQDLARALGGEDVTVQLRNGFDNGFPRAELVLRRVFHDSENKEQTLEEITWRAAYDSEGEVPGLAIYRSYRGVAPEDKLLDSQREGWEKDYPFVPLCRGVTFFRIQACRGEELLDQWATPALPPGVKVTISFAEPYETVRGTWDVPDEEKISRTLVVDATRPIKFSVAARGMEPNENTDPNQPPGDGRTPAGGPSPGRSGQPKSSTERSSPGPSSQPRSFKERSVNESAPRTPLPRSTRPR